MFVIDLVVLFTFQPQRAGEPTGDATAPQLELSADPRLLGCQPTHPRLARLLEAHHNALLQVTHID